MRKPQSLQIARAKGTRAEVVNHWFKEVLTPLLKKYGLENNPDRVFNADETSFCLSGRPTKVVARKGAKSPQYTVGGSGKENITVQVCVSATGKLLPPYIIYSGQRLMLNNTQDGPAGAKYAVTTKGWMTEANFLDWFRNMFILHLPEERPVLLILDGHESHIKYDVRELAVKHKIEIAKLPAHTTHILQPLDVEIMKPMKGLYDQAAHSLFLKERRYIKKIDFPSLGEVLNLNMPLMALDRNAIEDSSLLPSEPFTSQLSSPSQNPTQPTETQTPSQTQFTTRDSPPKHTTTSSKWNPSPIPTVISTHPAHTTK